jgi:hypothetical protein
MRSICYREQRTADGKRIYAGSTRRDG